MIIVANRLKLKSGFAAKMAPMFTKSETLKTMEGFVKIEVLSTKNLSDHDELNINMYWNTMEDFDRWKVSDGFKSDHKDFNSAAENSPILESELIIAEVLATLE